MNGIWKQIARSARKGKESEITIQFKGGVASVKTIPGSPPWGVKILIQVRVHKRGVMWVQTFDSVSGAKEALENEL